MAAYVLYGSRVRVHVVVHVFCAVVGIFALKSFWGSVVTPPTSAFIPVAGLSYSSRGQGQP